MDEDQPMSDDLAAKLAAISSRERERVGQEKVEERFLNGIAPMLVAPAPTSEVTAPPRVADLLDETAHLIVKYVRLPAPALAVLVACWIALTYTYQRFRYCGYLAFRSATPRCGKTQLLRIVAMLSFGHPKLTTTPPAAVLYRRKGKVLILDEVDKLRNADKENYGIVLSILNVGFEAGAVIERTETKTKDFEVKEWPVYGPKAFAGIEGLADTLSDRAFQIQMERTPQRMPRFSMRLLDELADQLREGFTQWASAHGDEAEAAYEALPDALPTLKGFDDRFQDIAEPLIVLAALADEERPEGPAVLPRLLVGLGAAAGRREPSGRERQLLTFLDIAELLLNDAEEVFVGSSVLVERCQEREDLSRIETPRALAGFLKHFDLFPGFNSKKTERGYTVRREWLTEWRQKYGERQEDT
jgi:Protein of unknown function (DUF3631)